MKTLQALVAPPPPAQQESTPAHSTPQPPGVARAHSHPQRRLRKTALRSVITTAMTIAAVVLPGSAAASDEGMTVRSEESARIDAWVEDAMAARDVPGTAVAVVRDGEVTHLAGYGVADDADRVVRPETPFILGSVSKPFTAVVVAQLVDEGLLTWDEPVWPHLSHLVDERPEGFETVTVEQLLTHTGGLSMTVGTAGTVTIHQGPDALDRRVDELLSHPLASEPGETFTYSNAGFMLLASVIEQVTGRAFAAELDARVFKPLNMTGSFASGTDARRADMATGHQQWFGQWRPVDLPYDDAGVAMGYIVSTASDLVKFMQAHLDGHPTIPATAADIANDTVTPTGWTTPLDAGYGHGWFVDEIAGRPIVSHPGSLGHFTAHILLAPGPDDLGIAVLSNASSFLAGHEAQYDLGLGLTRVMLGEQPQPFGPSLLTTIVVPVFAWSVVAVLIGLVLRYLVRLRSRGLPTPKGRGPRHWLRSLIPGIAYLAVGAGLLTAAPLGLARHFYPDGGWAVTVIAYLATFWGAVRLVIGLSALRSQGVERVKQPMQTISDERSPDHPSAPSASQQAEQINSEIRPNR
jgi:CubicO group peptidase (beta-lactamase class C family)